MSPPCKWQHHQWSECVHQQVYKTSSFRASFLLKSKSSIEFIQGSPPVIGQLLVTFKTTIRFPNVMNNYLAIVAMYGNNNGSNFCALCLLGSPFQSGIVKMIQHIAIVFYKVCLFFRGASFTKFTNLPSFLSCGEQCTTPQAFQPSASTTFANAQYSLQSLSIWNSFVSTVLYRW